MTEPSKQTTSVNIQVPTMENLAARRPLIPAAFALIILFFFLSFCDFKCGGKTAASVTGFNLVTGTHLKMAGTDMFNDNLFGDTGQRNQTAQANKSEDIPASIWAILALGAAIGGLVVFMRKAKNESQLGTGIAAAGFISLIILRSVIKSRVEEQGAGMMGIEASFQFGYWASLFAFIIAGGLSFLRLRSSPKPGV